MDGNKKVQKDVILQTDEMKEGSPELERLRVRQCQEIAKHYRLTQSLCQRDIAYWNKQLADEQEFTPNFVSKYHAYLFYFNLVLTTQLCGPLTGILFFAFPALYDTNSPITVWFGKRQISGWKVPLFYFMVTTLMWLSGSGPYLVKDYISWAMKFDIALQGFTRSLLVFPFCIYYANILKIHLFTYKNEISQHGWKFKMYKHQLKIDECTFQFDLIDRSGCDEISQIPGCKMLPHCKRTKGTGKWLNALGVFVPLLFAVFYWSDIGMTDAGCNATLDMNFAVNSNKTKPVLQVTLANGTKTTKLGVATSKYIRLRVFGTGMRDGFVMAFGYLVEMALLSAMYNLLYNVYLIHSVFNQYCLALSALQNFHCSVKELDNFYTLCQCEDYYTEEDYFEQNPQANKQSDPTHTYSTDICEAIWSKSGYYEAPYKFKFEEKKLKKQQAPWSAVDAQDTTFYPVCINAKITAPIDTVNIKNIQNLMILRRLAFGIYQPIAMKAQQFLLLAFLTFFAGAYMLFTSVFQNPRNATSAAVFYTMYPPKQIWWYLILFSVFYLLPIVCSFFVIFYLEMQINNYFIYQSNQWFAQAQTYQRVSNFASHYFQQDGGSYAEFQARDNALIVVKKYNAADDDLFSFTYNDTANNNPNAIHKGMHSIGYRYYNKPDNNPTEDAELGVVDGQQKQGQNKHKLQDKFAMITQSDNPYVAFIIQRLTQDHGGESNSNLNIILGNYAGTYQSAMSDMSADAFYKQFYFMEFFPINTRFLNTVGALVFWYIFTAAKAIIVSAANKEKKGATT